MLDIHSLEIFSYTCNCRLKNTQSPVFHRFYSNFCKITQEDPIGTQKVRTDIQDIRPQMKTDL